MSPSAFAQALLLSVCMNVPPSPRRRQAMETKDSLVDQRRLITSSSSALTSMATMFPAINRVMGSIQFRKTRENIVLALVIASCVCFTLWYLVG